ncbi:class I SAM-dependent methyltransferase [Micavibrio aeruginosavorus]|uniref:Putative methyltransferase n=1 Tax=Micavibrio aeruginosavorus (strain ARL-13) TaxID=856793 RepID=G2KLW2_MICAA|nr:class I SAM-dependent methyltransferase [Micavibrio aeruginosavorus]AEP09341.1 putative methyltransferase [Micavibrio aeruginosavorus ARL-13]
MLNKMKHGDFTGLAQDYSDYRPDYSPAVLRAILSSAQVPVNEIDFVDVGAGTGIWTRMVSAAGVRSSVAVEPNDDMRHQGENHTDNANIKWFKGAGEETGLPDSSADILSMASSFHWVDFDRGTQEFCRVLRPGGVFVAIWNPRYIESNPLLVEIEAHLQTLKGETITRVSSGRSPFTEGLFDKLHGCGRFSDVLYVESRHTIPFSKERYLGAWRSVNDLRVQLGPEKFQNFLSWVEDKISDTDVIEAEYLTRAWIARKPV